MFLPIIKIEKMTFHKALCARACVRSLRDGVFFVLFFPFDWGIVCLSHQKSLNLKMFNILFLVIFKKLANHTVMYYPNFLRMVFTFYCLDYQIYGFATRM